MVSINSKRRSDAFPIGAYQTGRSGNIVDHRRAFDAHFLKREEVWCDRIAFLAVLPDFWKWSAEKSGRQTKTMSPPTRLLYADHNSKRLFVSVGTYLFFCSSSDRNLALEPKMGDCSGGDSDSYDGFTVVLLCPLSNGYSWWNPPWNGTCAFEHPDCGKDAGQREMEQLAK